MTPRRLTVTFLNHIFKISSSHFSDITSQVSPTSKFIYYEHSKIAKILLKNSSDSENPPAFDVRCKLPLYPLRVGCQSSPLSNIFSVYFLRMNSEQKTVKSVKNGQNFYPTLKPGFLTFLKYNYFQQILNIFFLKTIAYTIILPLLLPILPPIRIIVTFINYIFKISYSQMYQI